MRKAKWEIPIAILRFQRYVNFRFALSFCIEKHMKVYIYAR